MSATQPKPVPSLYAWECRIIGIDPGGDMGVCICQDGVPIYTETEWYPAQMASVVKASSIPVIAVIEHHTPHGKWGMKQFRTMQRRVGQATRDCENAGIPENHIVFVEPNVWQGAMGFGGSLRSAERKRAAKQRAMSFQGIAERYANDKLTSDVADAICIAVWGSFAGEVGGVLGAINIVDKQVALQAIVDARRA